MKDYIKRIRRISPNDAVNGSVLNSVVQQLQHNIDLLYSSQNNTRQDKNLAELLYGNLLDYDQVGYKRFVNGGMMDTVEKIVAFDVSAGNTELEELEIYDSKHFLTWSLPSGVQNNVRLFRNIKVPEALYGQKILVGFKLMGFENGLVQTNERFDIYVNNVYAGSGDTGFTIEDDNAFFKTIYGVYDLGAEETNLEIRIERSITNDATPSDYVIRVQNVFAGLHTLSNSSYELNFPTEIGPFKGVVPDINYFYDFENVSINPIPSFLFKSLITSVSSAESPYNIDIDIAQDTSLDNFYVAYASTGDGTGSSAGNRMSAADFFTTSKAFSSIVANFEGSLDYDEFEFNDGVSYDITFEGDVTVSGGLNVSASTNVDIKTDFNLTTSAISVDDASLSISSDTVDNNELFITETITLDKGKMDVDATLFSMPIASDGEVQVLNGSFLDVNLLDSAKTNASALYGFGFSTGPLAIDNYSSMKVNNSNTVLDGHIGFGDGVASSALVTSHSSLRIENIDNVSTSSADKTLVAKKHSNIDIESLQLDGGVTAFDAYDLSVYCSLSTVGISGMTGTLEQSYVHGFE